MHTEKGQIIEVTEGENSALTGDLNRASLRNMTAQIMG